MTHDLFNPDLSSVLPSAAAADPDEHNETAQDFKYPADVAQNDAVADSRSYRCCIDIGRCDVWGAVGVPRDRYDSQDA